MQRILILFTGGTIGSCKEEGSISLANSYPSVLIEKYREMNQREVEFVCRMPFSILSEDSQGHILRTLCETVEAALSEAFDGIIIAHGSDTLQYSGAALAFYLQNPAVPIILVASNYVLSDARANGFANFFCAVEAIGHAVQPSVYISYKNVGEPCKLHYAVNCLPHGFHDDRLYSIRPEAGLYAEGQFEKRDTGIRKRQKQEFKLPLSEASAVLFLKSYPGIVYPQIDKQIRAVLLEDYHSGTLPGNTSLRLFLKEAEKCGVPVFVCGTGCKDAYASVNSWQSQVYVLPVASPLVIYIKLWLSLESTSSVEMLLSLMEKDIAGEYI